jgi:hypothetical protein
MRSFVLALGLAICCGAVGVEVGPGEAESAEVGRDEVVQNEAGWSDARPVVAIGEWSAAVEGLRGRLIIAQKYPHGDANYIETRVYVEVENSPEGDGVKQTIDFYFDPEQLTCELVDAAGKAVPQEPSFGSGGRPGACWVTLPYDSTMRLRVNPYGFGRAKEEGLLIPLGNATWLVPTDATGEFFLSGTFVVSPPAALARGSVWSGTLTFPKMKVAAPKRGA